MSLKPKKHSDIQKMKEKMNVKASKMNTLSKLPPYTMIVSEGVKTEPLYLRGFVNKINEKYKSISKEPHIVVYGTGRNTKSLMQFEAEARVKPEMAVAWSNESIELWFLLHFQEYLSNNGRTQYIEKLNEYFDYSKTREDLYDVIMEKGSLENAKRRARKMYQEFITAGETSMAAMVPATRMFELIEELEQYINV